MDGLIELIIVLIRAFISSGRSEGRLRGRLISHLEDRASCWLDCVSAQVVKLRSIAKLGDAALMELVMERSTVVAIEKVTKFGLQSHPSRPGKSVTAREIMRFLASCLFVVSMSSH